MAFEPNIIAYIKWLSLSGRNNFALPPSTAPFLLAQKKHQVPEVAVSQKKRKIKVLMLPTESKQSIHWDRRPLGSFEGTFHLTVVLCGAMGQAHGLPPAGEELTTDLTQAAPAFKGEDECTSQLHDTVGWV